MLADLISHLLDAFLELSWAEQYFHKIPFRVLEFRGREDDLF